VNTENSEIGNAFITKGHDNDYKTKGVQVRLSHLTTFSVDNTKLSSVSIYP